MVRQDDGIDAEINGNDGVLERLHPLEHKLAGPDAPEPGDVGSGDRGIEHLREQVADRAPGRGERRELQRPRREQVAPPPRIHGHARERAQGELRRNRQAIADIAQANAANRGIDREDEGVVAGEFGALHQRLARHPVAPHVELEPAPRIGRDLGECLDRGCPEGRERVGNPDVAGHLRDRGLAHVMHHPGEPRRAEGEGQGGSLTEHLHRAVDLGDITQHPRRELHPRIGLDRSSKRELGAGGTIGVVEHRSRHAAHCESADVSDARAPLEPGLPAGERAIPASDEGQDLARSRQSSIDHGDSSCHAVRCIRCLSADALSEADPLVS